MHYKETKYGFQYGALSIERHMSDDKKGWVIIGLKTPKCELDVYVTKTGKVRIFDRLGLDIDGELGRELK